MAAGANAAFKHYNLFVPTTATTAVFSVLGTNRTLVVSKLTVITIANGTFSLSIAASGAAGAGLIAYNASLNIGEIYTETGLIVLTGETINIAGSTGNAFVINVFGEEVDAS